jgi:hypothetical protein
LTESFGVAPAFGRHADAPSKGPVEGGLRFGLRRQSNFTGQAEARERRLMSFGPFSAADLAEFYS